MEIAFKAVSVVSGLIGALFLLLAITTEWANNAKRGTLRIDTKMWLICGSCGAVAITVSYFSWGFGV